MSLLRWLTMGQKSTIILSIGLLFILFGCFRPVRTPATVSAWPPFTMEYREEGQVHVRAWGTGTQRYQFIYNNKRDWTHTIIDSTRKEVIGSYKRYTGESLVEFEASSNYTTTVDTSKDAYPYIPAQWLTIGYIKGLPHMSNVTIVETTDLALAKLIEKIESPCDPHNPNLPQCKPGQTVHSGSREITYRLDTLIPVLVVDKVDGEIIYTATVEKLALR